MFELIQQITNVYGAAGRETAVADLIESLAAELEHVKQERDGLNIMLGQAQSMLETRTRERDAAFSELERRDREKGCVTCALYKPRHYTPICTMCNKCDKWEWRGMKEGSSCARFFSGESRSTMGSGSKVI